MPTPLSNDELFTYSKSNPDKLIFIDFSATWCVPCKNIKPFVDYLQENYPNVDFHYIDIEDETRDTIVSNFNINKVPTFVYYKDGIICNTIIGTNKDKIEEVLNENL